MRKLGEVIGWWSQNRQEAKPKLGLVFLNMRVHTPWGLLRLTPPAKIGQLRLRFPSPHIRQDNRLPCLGDKTASGKQPLNKYSKPSYWCVPLGLTKSALSTYSARSYWVSAICQASSPLRGAKMNKEAFVKGQRSLVMGTYQEPKGEWKVLSALASLVTKEATWSLIWLLRIRGESITPKPSIFQRLLVPLPPLVYHW